MNRDDITPEFLRKLLRYDPETGKLFGLKRPLEMFEDGHQSAEQRRNRWNGQFAGKEAFCLNSQGYVTGRIFDMNFSAHRVAWALTYGYWPDGQIDHIDGNRANNKLKNLRAVSPHENQKNKAIGSKNTSGYLGVRWRNEKGKWVSTIRYKGKKIHLGYFDEIQDAIAARKQAEKKYGFHPNHGRTND
jgi:hypothetical protein